MLVLSRRTGEQIVIGSNVVVTVLSTTRGRVRVGIEAPRQVDVRRSELLDETHERMQESDLPLLAGSVH